MLAPLLSDMTFLSTCPTFLIYTLAKLMRKYFIFKTHVRWLQIVYFWSFLQEPFFLLKNTIDTWKSWHTVHLFIYLVDLWIWSFHLAKFPENRLDHININCSLLTLCYLSKQQQNTWISDTHRERDRQTYWDTMDLGSGERLWQIARRTF